MKFITWSEIHTLQMTWNLKFLGAAPFSDIFYDTYNTEKSEIKSIQKCYR